MPKPSTEGRWEPWEGGRCWIDREGDRTYYIRKRVGGRRYEIRTPATVASVAFEHLKRFLADPEGYQPQGEVRAEPIYLDEKLASEFLAWCRDEKKNSPDWLRHQRDYIAWWADRLRGIDLRRATLADHILPPLKGAPARAHRIAVVKSVFSYLRKQTHQITAAQDPTFGTLSVPQAQPELWRRSKAVPLERFKLVMKRLDGRWRDLLTIQGGTGWHTTEIQRFTRGGSMEPLPTGVKGRGVAGVLVCPETKGGETLRTAVSAPVLAAAKRSLTAGSFDRRKYEKAVAGGCLAAKVPVFTPAMMRHSVATEAVNRGADPAQVAAFLGHRSPRTTRRFYATLATPAKVPTLA
jgi:integrase